MPNAALTNALPQTVSVDIAKLILSLSLLTLPLMMTSLLLTLPLLTPSLLLTLLLLLPSHALNCMLPVSPHESRSSFHHAAEFLMQFVLVASHFVALPALTLALPVGAFEFSNFHSQAAGSTPANMIPMMTSTDYDHTKHEANRMKTSDCDRCSHSLITTSVSSSLIPPSLARCSILWCDAWVCGATLGFVVRRLGLGICPSTSHSHSHALTITCTR